MHPTDTYITDLLEACSSVAHLPGVPKETQVAYHELLGYLQDRYAVDENLLKSGFATDDQRRQVAAALAAAQAESNPELRRRFQALAASLQGWQPAQAVGVSLEEVQARLLKIEQVAASGTGVQIVRSRFDENVEVDNVRVYGVPVQEPDQSSAPPRNGSRTPFPPAVSLEDVETGGGITIDSITQTLTQIVLGAPPDKHAARQRRNMLRLVEDTWLKGVLTPSLHAGTPLHLQLEPLPDLVDNRPFDKLVQMPHVPPSTISPQQDIVDIFYESQQRLLIVGEPGSGKTTLLLIIAQAMINAARNDADLPIPVVLNLASWSSQHNSLQAWILAELKEKYQVPNKVAQPWLAHDDLLLLLDGLDEVGEAERARCLAAINQFLGEHLVPMVICSRKMEYAALNTRLRLQRAVQVQPLTQQQIDNYLHAAQLEYSGLAELIESDTQVRELARSPLMLHIMTVAASSLPASAWSSGISAEAWRSQLFATYVRTMFQRRSGYHPYSPQQTVHWLGWLARQMTAYEQSIFLLEQLQPTLLPTRRWRFLYHTAVRAVGVLVFLVTCILTGVVAGIVSPHQDALVGLLVGLALGSIIGLALVVASLFARWMPKVLAALLTIGVVSIVLALTPELSLRHAVILALFVGLFGSLAGLSLAGRQSIQPVNSITWAWPRLRLGLGLGLIASIVLAIVIALVTNEPRVGLALGSLVGVCCLLPVILFEMTKSDAVKPSISPNQGIHRSLRTSVIIFGMLTFTSSLLGIVLQILYDNNIRNGLVFGLSVGVPIGLVVAFAAGGAVCIQHYLLRAILAGSGVIPWRCQRFLDYVTERVFLRRIGGAYIFYHRLLMEYFATSKEETHGEDVSGID